MKLSLLHLLRPLSETRKKNKTNRRNNNVLFPDSSKFFRHPVVSNMFVIFMTCEETTVKLGKSITANHKSGKAFSKAKAQSD